MNPSASNGPVTGKGAGLPNQDTLNNPKIFNSQGYNTFNRSLRRLLTTRFADVHPFFAQDAIEGDNVRFRSSHDLRTYTMKSPLMSDVRMNEDFFQVPWSSILPNTWEYIYRIPVRGDDVPAGVHPVMDISWLMEMLYHNGSGYPTSVWMTVLPTLFTATTPAFSNDPTVFQMCSVIWLLNAIGGSDSLLKNLGYSFPKSELFDELYSDFVNELYQFLVARGIVIRCIGLTPTVQDPEGTNVYRDYSFNSPGSLFNFLDDFYKGSLGDYFVCLPSSTYTPAASANDVIDAFDSTFNDFFGISQLLYKIDAYDVEGYSSPGLRSGVPQRAIDLKRLAAYHQVVAQYYSNSHIDDVYTGKQWNDAMMSLARRVYTDAGSFELNGTYVNYDAISSHYINGSRGILFRFVEGIMNNDPFVDSGTGTPYFWLNSLYYLINLFSYGSSLRFGDYFASSRLQPLASGDYTAAVGPNGVSAIDMNKALWMQRLLNAVNRTAQNIYEYLQSIAGVRPARIAPQPNFVASQSFKLNSAETDNTGDAQRRAQTLQADNITTSQLHSADSEFAFEVYCDEPSVLLGLLSFTAQYVYPHSIDKSFDMRDRYDWFNHFLQHTGDQAVMLHELDANNRIDDYFGYQLKYAQFKYGISQATGGFVTNALPSWALLWDPGSSGVGTFGFSLADNLTGWFVRNHSGEFDRFYASLTEVDPANRFHFMLSMFLDVQANSRQENFPDLV